MNKTNFGRLALGITLAAAFLALGAVQAHAQAKPRIEVSITSAKEVTVMKDGKETVQTVPSDKVKPGEVMVYTIEYTNTGDGEAKNAAIVDPVPESTVYVVESASGDGTEITCSIDGGKTYHAQPVKVKVTRPDGTVEEINAEPEAYTHVRWVVKSVPPGGSGTASFKTQVE